MNESLPRGNASASTMRTLWRRLRPFVRRDLRGRLISAAIAAVVIAGLSWFGIAAFTHLDSSAAQAVRVQLGLEHEKAICSDDDDTPDCSYDDRAQAEVDRQWSQDLRIRAAVLQELDLRIDATLDNLTEAEALLARQNFNYVNQKVAGGDPKLTELLTLPELSPLPELYYYVDGRGYGDLHELATWSPSGVRDLEDMNDSVLGGIAEVRRELSRYQGLIASQRSRDAADDPQVSDVFIDRRSAMLDVRVRAEHFQMSTEAQNWFRDGRAEDMSRSAFNLAEAYPAEFSSALLSANKTWEGGWDSPRWEPRHKPTERYRSPITDEQRYELTGTLLFVVACIVFLVVAPIVTATATAREREAGTLPVLRMTGMRAGDLALAMAIGPNVFALILGGSLLGTGTLLLAMSGHACDLLLPLGLLAVLTAATVLTAIGLGDALGQRVNAMIVGGLVGVGIVIPGLLGSALAALNVADTGLLLGPVPALVATVTRFGDIHGLGLEFSGELTKTMLAYSVALQVGLGLACLGSWRRRVEQGWAPLFRPQEGVLLALGSIGCSALTLLDMTGHHDTQDFNALNLLTFLSSVFLLPVLAWLLVASLRRPARARAVADYVEARWAFMRFQGFVVTAAMLVGLTYGLIMRGAGLGSDNAELMWATLAQMLLVAETGVAALLWASRRREGKMRVAFVGGAAVIMQLLAVVGTYGLEVQHVAVTNGAAMPLLANADVSPYWTAFLILCWAIGLALVLTALMRRKDEVEVMVSPDEDDDEDDDDYGMPGRRLLH